MLQCSFLDVHCIDNSYDERGNNLKNVMNIWAHRGCSQRYPENTLLSFEKAMNIPGLTGIELDIQLTKDGELVVIHDERVDRTTDGIGYVKDYNLSDLKKLHVYDENNSFQSIPKMEEVFDMLQNCMLEGLLLNIELKTNIYPYFGIEEKIVDMVARYNLEKKVVYSSFYANSLNLIRKLSPNAEIGILDTKVSDCMWKLKGGCGATVLHPYWRGIDMKKEELEGYTVRA